MTSLTVLVPVYNEQHLVATSLARLELLARSPHLERIQVVVVDDSSKDATPEILRAFAAERGISLAAAAPHAPRAPRAKAPPEAALLGRGGAGKFEWVFLRHV